MAQCRNMQSKVSRKVAAFFSGGSGGNIVHALSLETTRAPLTILKEKRVVATCDSDCRAYTRAEFESFFGEGAQDYWNSALRFQISTVAAYPPMSESDVEELVPFAGVVFQEGEPVGVHVIGANAIRQPYPKWSQVTRRRGPRASLRRHHDRKMLALIRSGLTVALAVAVLSW